MINPFLTNRKIIHQALEREKILLPVEDIEYTVEEKKAKGDNLKFLHLEGIPFSQYSSSPNVWVFDFEMDENVILHTPSCKKMEKALLVFSSNTVYVILIEMKSTLMGSGNQGIGENGIEAKIKESLSKLSLFTTPFVFTEKHNYIKKIKFYSIITYNTEIITHEANQDQKIKKYNLYDAFISSQGGIAKNENIRDLFGQNFDVKMFFIKNNTTNPIEFTIDLSELINEEPFTNAIYHDFICP